MNLTANSTSTTETENGAPPPPPTLLSFTNCAPNKKQYQPLSSTNNGALKNLYHHRHYPAPPPLYKECLKNHAAAMGGHALDGCGEFMPLLTCPAAALTCAACGCHRNFHRRCSAEPPISPESSPSPTCYRALWPCYPAPDQLMLDPATPKGKASPEGSRKRFRTRFTREQKEEMLSFSEKLGWKFQRSDEGAIEEFCKKVGISRGVLKVWMHNNKNTFGKREVVDFPTNSDGNVVVLKLENNGHIYTINGGTDLHFSGNGSSSSS